MKTDLERRLVNETPFSSLESARPRSVHPEVWRIAWPSVLTFLLMTTNSILDRAFVGQLGPTALAGVGVGGQVVFMLVSLSMAITTGTTALVARFTGAQNTEDTLHATGKSLSLGFAGGLICMIAVYALLWPLLHALGLAPDAQKQCHAFLSVALLGTVPSFLVNVIYSSFRGLGDTRTPLKVMILANSVHIAGGWTFTLGHFGAPRLGVVGAGMALAASNFVSMAVYFYLLRRSILRESIHPRYARIAKDWTQRILKIGIPAAFTALLRVTSMMAFTGVLARTAEKTAAVAALPIGLTAESIAFMPGFGYSVAASALVGQALGARDPERAERYGWAATWQAMGVMSLMGLLFFVAAEPFARLFSADPTVVKIAVSYLRIMAISEPFLAIGMVLTGALQGAGDTLRPTILTAFTFWVFRLPVAWWLALKLGYNASGGWIAMAATTIVGGLLTIFLFRDGRWKRIRV